MKNLTLLSVIVTFGVVLPWITYAQNRGDNHAATKTDIEQLSQKIDKLDQRFNELDRKVDNLKVSVDELDKRLSGLIAATNTRIDDTNSKIDFLLTMLTLVFGGSLLGLLMWLFQTVKSRKEVTEGLTPRQREEILELIRLVRT
jgi:predicted transcriptional regulator